MAEYYAVLSKAITGLTSASPDTRRAVYDKARNALIGQLRAIDPPLPTAEISRQRLELEEAIRRVEREISTGTLPSIAPLRVQAQIQAVPPPPPRGGRAATADDAAAPTEGPTRRTPQDIFRQAIREAESRGGPPPASASGQPAPRSLAGRASSAQRGAANRAAAEDETGQGFDPTVTSDITPDMDEESAPPLAAEPAVPLSPNTRNLKPSARPGEPRLQPDYGFNGDREAPPPRSVRPPPERVREVRLGPAPIDPRIDDVAPTRRGNRRGEAAEDNVDAQPRARRSRIPLILLALALILVGGVAYAGWTQWGRISAIITALEKPATKPTPTATVAVPAGPTPSPLPALAPAPAPDSTKNGDRLLPSGQTVPGPTPVAPTPGTAGPGGSVRIVGQDAGVAPTVPAPGAKPAPGQQASLGTAPSGQSGPAVTQKATLYEEPTDPSVKGGFAFAGTVSWSFVNSPVDGPEVVGLVNIPDRKMTVKVVVHRNSDNTLPASHLIELMVTTPPDFPGKGIQTIPTIFLASNEPESGNVLMGANATVGPGLYWIALSNTPKDITTNLGLFKSRGWMDVHIVYQTGQRASLVLEEGASGAQAFTQALSAWQTG